MYHPILLEYFARRSYDPRGEAAKTTIRDIELSFDDPTAIDYINWYDFSRASGIDEDAFGEVYNEGWGVNAEVDRLWNLLHEVIRLVPPDTPLDDYL